MGSPAPEGEGQGPVVIHAWSAPRSLSTSLMYSFAQVRGPPNFLLLDRKAFCRGRRGFGAIWGSSE